MMSYFLHSPELPIIGWVSASIAALLQYSGDKGFGFLGRPKGLLHRLIVAGSFYALWVVTVYYLDVVTGKYYSGLLGSYLGLPIASIGLALIASAPNGIWACFDPFMYRDRTQDNVENDPADKRNDFWRRIIFYPLNDITLVALSFEIYLQNWHAPQFNRDDRLIILATYLCVRVLLGTARAIARARRLPWLLLPAVLANAILLVVYWPFILDLFQRFGWVSLVVFAAFFAIMGSMVEMYKRVFIKISPESVKIASFIFLVISLAVGALELFGPSIFSS